MLIGVGTDILHLPRLLNLFARRSQEHFAQRILTTSELAVFHALPASDASRRVRFLAVRYSGNARRYLMCYTNCNLSWSLKEAAYKAVFPTRRLVWKDVEITRCAAGKPSLEVNDTLGLSSKLHCSVSHDGDYVVAFVVAEDTSRNSTS